MALECDGCISPLDYDFHMHDVMVMSENNFEALLKNIGTCQTCCGQLRSLRMECRIKGRSACCSKDLVRPLQCSLQDRIVALAQAFVNSSR